MAHGNGTRARTRGTLKAQCSARSGCSAHCASWWLELVAEWWPECVDNAGNARTVRDISEARAAGTAGPHDHRRTVGGSVMATTLARDLDDDAQAFADYLAADTQQAREDIARQLARRGYL